MDLKITPLNRIFKDYQNQERIGELNRKVATKRVQGQVDKVTLSKEALAMMSSGRPPGENPGGASAPVSSPEPPLETAAEIPPVEP